MGSTFDQSLTNPHHLDDSSDTHRILARTVLPGNLPDPGIDLQRPESIAHHFGDQNESFCDPGSGVVLLYRPAEGKGLFVEDGSASSGKALDRSETVSGCDPNRRRIPWLNPIRHAKSQNRVGSMKPEHRSDLPGRHRIEHSMADGDIKSRVLGEGISPHENLTHLPEHKPGDWYRHAHCQAMEPLGRLARFTTGYPVNGGQVRRRALTALSIVIILGLAACGDTPFQSLGERSSRWVTAPTVLTTSTVPTTIALARDAANLIWYNDDLGAGPENPEDVVAAVYARREGDRFIQASREEIGKVLEDVQFPSRVPPLSEYVSSQLVIENNGVVSDDPSAAFGIWTAEPYSKSRSVAQLIVIRVYRDAETAAEVETDAADLTCARFAAEQTEGCDIEEIGGRTTWVLKDGSGTTMIWFEGIYRYEMFGRPFAAVEALRQTAASMMPLDAAAETS
jgi:hypothetical protein